MTMTLPAVAQAPGLIPIPSARPLHVTPLFWKQSWWSSKKTVPVLLELLQDGTLRLINSDGVVATEQACHTVATWGRSTAMVDLDFNGQVVTLVAIGENSSPGHNQAMEIYLRWCEGRTGQDPQQWRRGRNGQSRDGDEGWETIETWRDMLASVGVTDQLTGHNEAPRVTSLEPTPTEQVMSLAMQPAPRRPRRGMEPGASARRMAT
jgi:hypothetical protein